LDRFHRKVGVYNKPHIWASDLLSAGEEWHSTYSRHNPEFRKLAMVVLSKPIGAGAPERNWADVKTVWDSTSAKMHTDKVEKKVIIHGAAHRLQSLTGLHTWRTGKSQSFWKLTLWQSLKRVRT
jgi:hypothetical protein